MEPTKMFLGCPLKVAVLEVFHQRKVLENLHRLAHINIKVTSIWEKGLHGILRQNGRDSREEI